MFIEICELNKLIIIFDRCIKYKLSFIQPSAFNFLIWIITDGLPHYFMQLIISQERDKKNFIFLNYSKFSESMWLKNNIENKLLT